MFINFSKLCRLVSGKFQIIQVWIPSKVSGPGCKWVEQLRMAFAQFGCHYIETLPQQLAAGGRVFALIARKLSHSTLFFELADCNESVFVAVIVIANVIVLPLMAKLAVCSPTWSRPFV